MDSKRKNIQELQLNINDASDNLISLYRDLGRRLLTDNAGENAEKTNLYRSLLSQRDEFTSNINTIRQGIERKQEIASFINEVNKHIAELKKDQDSLFEKLGESIFKNYDEAYSSAFGTSFSVAKEEGNKLIEKESLLSEIKNQLEQSNVLQKIGLKIKMISLEAGISQHKAKTLKAFREGGCAVFKSGVLDSKISGDSSISKEIISAYNECSKVGTKIKEQEDRISLLNEESEKIKESFLVNGKENPLVKMENLKSEIKNCDNQIERLCNEAGLSYLDKFVGDDGEYTSESIPESYRSWIEQGSILRKTRADLGRKVQYLEICLKLENTEALIISYKESIAENSSKILKLQEINENLQKKIDNVSAEREELLAEKLKMEQ